MPDSPTIPDLFRQIASLMLKVCEHPDVDRALGGEAGEFPFGMSLDDQAYECIDFAERIQALTDPVMAAARVSMLAEDALRLAIARHGAFGPGVDDLRRARDAARAEEGRVRGAVWERENAAPRA